MESLRFVNQATKRWYRLDWGLDLLGDFVLVQHWGGLGSALGSHLVRRFDCVSDLSLASQRLVQRRIKRGYSSAGAP
jgi:predicted DNA-binding WGR domain protein